MTFDSLGLDSRILSALKKQGYTSPTPIQAQSIPLLLNGHDLLGTAQTGTGKTAAFTIPIIQQILQSPSKKRRINRKYKKYVSSIFDSGTRKK